MLKFNLKSYKEDLIVKKTSKDKLITISILPLMWSIYFLFELFTGRIHNISTVFLNIALIIIFALVGFLIYKAFLRYNLGFNSKLTIIIFIIFLLIDQGSKLIIGLYFFDNKFDIIPDLLSFHPIINTKGSWLNARFDFGLGFNFLIIINAIALFFFVEIYRYIKSHGKKSFWADLTFIFIVCGALCSLIDKVFYGGSLDFIGISNLFIADIKDIYINLGIFSFIMEIYTSGYLSEDDNTSIKDDLKLLKKFLIFIKSDLLSLFTKK